MFWIKMQRMESYGLENPEYFNINENRLEELGQTLDEFMNDYIKILNDEFSWSAKHRGYQWEIIESPPLEWLEMMLAHSVDRIEDSIRMADIYKKYINKKQKENPGENPEKQIAYSNINLYDLDGKFLATVTLHPYSPSKEPEMILYRHRHFIKKDGVFRECTWMPAWTAEPSGENHER